MIAFSNRNTRELKRVEKDLKGKLREAKRAHELQLEKAFKSNTEGDDWTVNDSESISGRWIDVYTVLYTV